MNNGKYTQIETWLEDISDDIVSYTVSRDGRMGLIVTTLGPLENGDFLPYVEMMAGEVSEELSKKFGLQWTKMDWGTEHHLVSCFKG